MALRNSGWMTSNGAVHATTPTTAFNGALTDFCWNCQQGQSVKSELDTAVAEACFGSDLATLGQSTSTSAIWEIYDDGGNKIAYLEYSNSLILSLKLFRGSSTVTIGTIGLQAQVLSRIDCHVKIHASTGFVRLYVNGFPALAFSGDTVGSLTGRLIKGWIGRAESLTTASRNTWHSRGIWEDAAGETTVGINPTWKPPTGDSSTNTGWTGDYTNVDEPGVPGLDAIGVSANATREGFTFADPPVTSGILYAVFIGSYGAGDATYGYQHSIRLGSTDYDSGVDQAAPGDTTPKMREFGWLTNPATGLGWQASDLVGSELGVVSVNT